MIKTGQDYTTNWDLNQNHSIIEDIGISNSTNGVEKMFKGGKRKKVVE